MRQSTYDMDRTTDLLRFLSYIKSSKPTPKLRRNMTQKTQSAGVLTLPNRIPYSEILTYVRYVPQVGNSTAVVYRFRDRPAYGHGTDGII